MSDEQILETIECVFKKFINDNHITDDVLAEMAKSELWIDRYK